MTSHVSIEHDPDGPPLACKRATDTQGRPGIRAEAARLAGIDHPGVVRFVALRETDDGPTLVTEYVGPRTLATIGPVTTERAADLVADLASTVADLHALGITHGALRPEHVLVAGERIVLCGLGVEPIDRAPSEDVLGIGLALRGLLDPELEEEPIPDRRPWRRVPWLGYRHRALLTLADQATDDEPGRRPSARALADAVRELTGTAAPLTVAVPHSTPSAPGRAQALVDLVAVRLRHRPRRGAGRPRAARPRLAALLAGLGLGLVVLVLGVAGAAGRPSSPAAPAASAPGATARPSCPTTRAPVAADLDGDGCPNAVRIGPGWLEVDQRRYRVGRPGDELRVGDWDGDGLATVALLRPPAGELWLFPGWDPDAPVTARFAGRFPDGDGLLRRTGPGQDLLLVHRADGTATPVPAP